MAHFHLQSTLTDILLDSHSNPIRQQSIDEETKVQRQLILAQALLSVHAPAAMLVTCN